MEQKIVAAFGAAVVAAGAYRWRALTGPGAVAAAAIGFVIYGWGGAGAALPLLLFFVSASVWTKIGRRRRPLAPHPGGAPRPGDGTGEGADASGRGAVQVLANGIVPALAVLGAALLPRPWWIAAAAGALAAVTGDTWATEIGRFSRRPPVLITTGRRVRPGRSGAVSWPGTAGGAAGAMLLATAAGAAFVRWPLGSVEPPPDPRAFIAAAAAGGIIGFLADSVLGATVQARYVCVPCMAETESPVHRCGRRTARIAGVAGVTNDTVNLLTSIVGAVIAAVLVTFGD